MWVRLEGQVVSDSSKPHGVESDAFGPGHTLDALCGHAEGLSRDCHVDRRDVCVHGTTIHYILPQLLSSCMKSLDYFFHNMLISKGLSKNEN